jgi:hypothetical protein
MAQAADLTHLREQTEAAEIDPLDAQRIESDKWLILGHFLNLFGDDGDVDEVCRFLLHCGIDGTEIRKPGGWAVAVLRRYLTLDGYDVELAAKDLATFPPVAARLKELERDSDYRREWRAQQERRNRARRLKTSQISN